MTSNSILNGAKTLSVLALTILFSTIAFAQTNISLNQYKNNFYISGENTGSTLRTRPRIYVEPAASSNDIANPVVEAPKPAKKTVSILELERQAFELLNTRRIENGLQPVIWSDEVAGIARVHSQSMANNNFFSHQGLDGLTVDKRADSLGLKNWRRIGENIAYNRGYENPVEYAVLRWMQSATHRENLLSNKWKEAGVGIAIAPDGKTYYFTQVFMLRK
jgi:uncharacterized protein YkwD